MYSTCDAYAIRLFASQKEVETTEVMHDGLLQVVKSVEMTDECDLNFQNRGRKRWLSKAQLSFPQAHSLVRRSGLATKRAGTVHVLHVERWIISCIRYMYM